MNHGRWRWVPLAALLAGSWQVAWTQVDLTGYWGVGAGLDYQDWQARIPGPDFVDYTGLPINDSARTVALSYDAEQLEVPERQCLMYSPVYMLNNPGMFRMWADFNPDTGRELAWNTSDFGDMPGLKIWMDGRVPPSQYEAHPIDAFTVGRWDGEMLTTTTTHMRRGYLRRNGVPQSDQAVMTLHFMREGNLLTLSGEVDDPVYLTEPYIYSRVFIQNTGQSAQGGYPFPGRTQCRSAVTDSNFATVGTVPFHPPGYNAVINDLTTRLHVPHYAAMGGAETMYPEFRKRMRAEYVAPAKCDMYCCGWDGSSTLSLILPDCPSFLLGRRTIFRPPAPQTP